MVTNAWPDSLCVLPGHFAPQYLGANSSSKAALAYIQWLQQVVSDGNQSPDYATVRPSHACLLRFTQDMPALRETVSGTEISCSQVCAPLTVLAHPQGCMPLHPGKCHPLHFGEVQAYPEYQEADRPFGRGLAVWREPGNEAADGLQPVLVVWAGLPRLVRQGPPHCISFSSNAASHANWATDLPLT